MENNLEAQKSTEVAEPNNEENKNIDEVTFTDTNTDDKSDKATDDMAKGKEQKSKDENAKYAAQRRKREEEERTQKAIKKALEEDRKARSDETELEYVRKYIKINKFTNEPIKDKEDLETYKKMLEMDENGMDPVADFAKYETEKRRKARQETEAMNKSDESYYKRDTELFVEVYGKDEANKMLHDDAFMEYFDSLVKEKGGRFSILAARTMYDRDLAKKEASVKAKETAARVLANETAGTGSMTSSGGDNEEFFTKEQLSKMSPSEIEKNWGKVKKSYERLKN